MTVTDPTTPAEITAAAWDRTVDVARAANRRAIEGRFELTLASFEAFGRHGKGVTMLYTPRDIDGADLRNGEATGTGQWQGVRKATRTLSDWCDAVGVNYHTLNGYRQLVSWWYEADPTGLRDELGIPTHIAWEALRTARGFWMLAADFRTDLAEAGEPGNGKLWSLDEIEYLARVKRDDEIVRRRRRRSPTDQQRYENALKEIQRTIARATQVSVYLAENEIDEEQRETLLRHTREAQETYNGLVRELIGLSAVAPDAAAA